MNLPKILCVGFLLGLLSSYASEKELSKQFEQELSDLTRDNPENWAERFKALPESKRKEFIKWARHDGYGSWELRLFFLGDEEVVTKYVNGWLNGDQSEKYAMACSQRPDLIIRLEPALFRDEGIGDGKRWPLSFATVDLIVALVNRTPDFTPETRTWARTFPARVVGNAVQTGNKAGVTNEYLRGREVVRKWFRDNENAFRAKDYRAVRPGDIIPIEGEILGKPSPKGSAVPVQTGKLQAGNSAAATTVSATSHARTVGWLLLALLALGATAVTFMAVKKCGKRKKDDRNA